MNRKVRGIHSWCGGPRAAARDQAAVCRHGGQRAVSDSERAREATVRGHAEEDHGDTVPRQHADSHARRSSRRSVVCRLSAGRVGTAGRSRLLRWTARRPVTSVGAQTLPPPVRLRLADLPDGACDARRIEIAGTIAAADIWSGQLRIELTEGAHRIEIRVQDTRSSRHRRSSAHGSSRGASARRRQRTKRKSPIFGFWCPDSQS